jgi:hypothetical protein
MAHAHVVLASINNEDGSLCVDLFRRRDGTTGFEEFRRDVEDARGWFPVGGHAAAVFDDEATALAAAREAVPWLTSVTGR